MDDIEHPGAGDQAYTVLTLCRAAEALATGRQVSTLAARAGGQGFRSGPRSSTGPESRGTTADPT